MRFISAFTSLLLLLLSPLASAENSDAPSPIEELTAAAEQGDAYAARQLYMRYAVEGKTTESRQWAQRYAQILEEQADKGDSQAMLRLGAAYLNGSDRIKQDKQKAIQWFARASAAGEPSAAYILAELYTRDNKIELAQEEYQQAFQLYSKESTHDSTKGDAQYWRGLMLLKGQGTEKNVEEGLAQLEQAAQKGNTWAQEQLFKIYAEGSLAPKDEKRALGYAKNLADSHKNGMMAYALACAYLTGQGLEEDIEQGEHYLDQACAANIADAITLKASRLAQKEQYEEATPLYAQAASMGQSDAMTQLGSILLQGKGVDQDEQRGINYLQTAADKLGSHAAMLELAEHYNRIGETSLSDYWYVTASDLGVTQAMARRGLLHLNPNTEQSWNPTLTYRWWKMGSDAGDATCILYIRLFLFVFIPLILIISFLGPVLLMKHLERKALAQEKLHSPQNTQK